MLVKLIRLDLRFAYKKFMIMALILLALGLAMPHLGTTVLKVGGSIVFGVTMVVVPLMCIWLIVQHFQRNLFGSEGYLMFTLPVKATQLLFSKLVTTVIWFNLMFASAGLLVALMLRAQLPFERIRQALSWELFSHLLHIAANINITVIPIILAVFMGITFSSVAIRNKRAGIAWGIGVILTGVGSFVWSSVRLSGWNFLEMTVDHRQLLLKSITLTPLTSELINLAVSLGFGTLFFLITTRIMQRRLNLE